MTDIREELEARAAEDGIEFFLTMRTDPPEAGYTVLPTIEEVTGAPARTYAQWVAEHRAAFGG